MRVVSSLIEEDELSIEELQDLIEEIKNNTFANRFNHNKLKIRFTMMTKKKSNRWARLKLLLLLSVAAFCVSVFACTRQTEQMTQSETVSTPVNDSAKAFLESEASSSDNSTETQSLSIAFIDKAGIKLQSFTFEIEKPVNGYDIDYTDTFKELKEWFLSHDKLVNTVSIRASQNIPMGVITDLKQVVRESYGLKISYSSPKINQWGQ